MTQLSLTFTDLRGPFGGDTYDPSRDGRRLVRELDAVQGLMSDGQWRTLGEIRAAIQTGSEAGISARLRDLRKPGFGSFTVERRRRGPERNGYFEYRLVGDKP